MKKINILFVCKYNRFRSRVAEAYFKKINKNKNIKAKSAGLIKGNPLNKDTLKIVKKFGIEIQGQPKGLTSKTLSWQDATIIVSNDIPPKVFDKNKKYGKKVLVWKVKDVNEKDAKGKIRIIKEIIKRVDKLIKELGVKR